MIELHFKPLKLFLYDMSCVRLKLKLMSFNALKEKL